MTGAHRHTRSSECSGEGADGALDGGDGQDPHQVDRGLDGAGRQGDEGIAVDPAVGRDDRPAQTVVATLGDVQATCLLAGERCLNLPPATLTARIAGSAVVSGGLTACSTSPGRQAARRLAEKTNWAKESSRRA